MGAVSVFMVEGLSLPTLLANWMAIKVNQRVQCIIRRQSKRAKTSKGSTQNQTEEYPSNQREWKTPREAHSTKQKNTHQNLDLSCDRDHTKKNKINKSLAAVWHGTKIVRLYLDYYLLEIYNNYYKIILALSTEQTKTRWNIPMQGMRASNGSATPPSINPIELNVNTMRTYKGISPGHREWKRWFKRKSWPMTSVTQYQNGHLFPTQYINMMNRPHEYDGRMIPEKGVNNHLHHPKRMILAITIPSSGHIYGYQVIRNSSHQDNQTSIREDGKLHRKHTVPNRRTPIKILIWAVTEIKKIIK